MVMVRRFVLGLWLGGFGWGLCLGLGLGDLA